MTNQPTSQPLTNQQMDRQPISQQGSIFFSLALSNDQLANQPLTNQQMDRQPICQQGSIFFSLAYLVTNPLTNSQLQALVYDLSLIHI